MENHSLGVKCSCGHCEEGCINQKDKSFFASYGFDITKILLSVLIIVLSLTVKAISSFSLYLFIFSAVIVGYKVVITFVKNLISGKVFNEITLMLIASISAFVLGEYFEGSFILVLYETGELLEEIVTTSATKKIKSLNGLAVETVNLITKEGTKRIGVNEVKIGSLLQINKGDILPMESVIMERFAVFDMKSITGESKPCEFSFGSAVSSGAINMGESVIVKTKQEFAGSNIHKILQTVY